ncbi:MAG TPA: carboxypeptidase-like regulatory domain-containing protein, partial [Paludibacter sp.]
MKQKITLLLIVMFVGTSTLSAQNLSLSGVVVDKNTGETLIGASVVEKGANNRAITNFDGAFSLSVPNGATLAISYIGYIGQEIVVKNDAKLRILLAPDTKSLEEVVVVGYGTKKAGAVTGSVIQVKSSDILKTPAQSAIQSIQGKAAGVSIIATDEPGKSPTVMIRGINTVLGGRSPLYVI